MCNWYLYRQRYLLQNKKKNMRNTKITIKNPTGIDLDLAGVLCKQAVQYKSLITFAYEDGTANAKSVLSVLGSCVRGGDTIELFCDGVDEDDAVAAITEILSPTEYE